MEPAEQPLRSRARAIHNDQLHCLAHAHMWRLTHLCGQGFRAKNESLAQKLGALHSVLHRARSLASSLTGVLSW